jgi:hypothetical protein
MNRPAQIRAIYAELRQALDDSYSDRELVRLAHAIVIAHTNAGRIDDDYIVVPETARTLFARPLDEAMSDGGWSILDFETKRGTAYEDGARTEFEDDLSPEVRSLISRLNQIRRAS